MVNQLAVLGVDKRNLLEILMMITAWYLGCICPIRSFRGSGELDQVSAGGLSQPKAALFGQLGL